MKYITPSFARRGHIAQQETELAHLQAISRHFIDQDVQVVDQPIQLRPVTVRNIPMMPVQVVGQVKRG